MQQMFLHNLEMLIWESGGLRRVEVRVIVQSEQACHVSDLSRSKFRVRPRTSLNTQHALHQRLVFFALTTACFVLPAGDMLRQNDYAGQLLQATRPQACLPPANAVHMSAA